MIVCHSFFYKKYPKYLTRTVNLMRNVNDCAFFNHSDFDKFVLELRDTLNEDSGGRAECGDVSIFRSNGVVELTVKGGLDYAARLCFIKVETGYGYTFNSNKRVKAVRFEPDGEIRFLPR